MQIGSQLTGSPSTSALTLGPILLRVRLVAGAVSVLGGLLAGILFLAAIFSHQAVLVTAALTALIASMLGSAVTHAWRTWFLWRSGAWVGLDGSRRSRTERPRRFWALLTMHMLSGAASIGAAGYLASAAYAFRF